VAHNAVELSNKYRREKERFVVSDNEEGDQCGYQEFQTSVGPRHVIAGNPHGCERLVVKFVHVFVQQFVMHGSVATVEEEVKKKEHECEFPPPFRGS
tara:strand:- start:12 stop:302 length:291 start_codon:yes stop_codon:yes gene_type:complete